MKGWSCADGSKVLDVPPTKWTQSARPAMEKIARLMLANPHKTWVDILVAMEDIKAERPRPTPISSPP